MQKGYAETKEAKGKKKALIISVSDYSTNLQALEFCKNDGEETHKLLESLGYEIAVSHTIIGQAKFETMREAIYDFFNNAKSIGEDTLILYYSGHGVPAPDGDVCLASSEIDPDDPYRRGFSSYELTRLMQNSVSLRIVAILDCCFSGAAKVSWGTPGKAAEDAAARIGTNALEDKAKILEQQGEGKCILSASQATQEAFALKEGDHSIFTYYLLDGLKGKEKSVDTNGNVTPSTLGNYIHRAIMNLPPEKRPKQKPITKAEMSGDIILASYPNLAEKPVVDISTIIFEGNRFLNNEDYSKAIELFDEATKLNPKNYVAHAYKGLALLKSKKYDEAITSYNTALDINPQEIDALQNKGYALSKLTKYDEAIKCYEETLKIDPHNSKVWYYKGLALHALRKYDDAIGSFDKAISLNPTYVEASKNRELSLIELKKNEKLPELNQKQKHVQPPTSETEIPSRRIEKVGQQRGLFGIDSRILISIIGVVAVVGTVIALVILSNQGPNGDQGPFTQTPAPVNHPPIANNQSVTTDESKPVDITLTASDLDKKDNLTAKIVSVPLNGTLGTINQATGIVTYTPEPRFSGTDQFTFKVNDGKVNSNNVGTVKIIVEPNSPPFANNQSVTTDMNTTLDIRLTGSDKDQNDDLTATILSKPLHGVLGQINQKTGIVTYTPKSAFTGTDRFTFNVNDGKVDSDIPGTVGITINRQKTEPSNVPPTTNNQSVAITGPKAITTPTVTTTASSNIPPTANNQSVATTVDKATDITLTASDSNANARDNLTAEIVSEPIHGTLSDINQDTGVVTYAPDPGFTGTDSFTFKANDGKADSNNEGRVSITVNED